jgi:hypothetical protein
MANSRMALRAVGFRIGKSVVVLCAAGLMLIVSLGQEATSVRTAPTPSQSAMVPGWLVGEYVVGSGLYGTALKLLPKSRFEFRTYRDALGVPTKHNQGTFRLKGTVLTWSPERPIIADEEWERLPTRLLVVRWGARRYLVPLVPSDREAILGFCNTVNQGYEPRKFIAGYPYLNGGDEGKAVTGLPDLPGKWKGFLLKKPIEGKILRVVSRNVAEISVGGALGLRPGMALVDKKTRPYGNQFTVLSVQPKTARVRWEQDIGSATTIKPGDKVTTLARVETGRQGDRRSRRSATGGTAKEAIQEAGREEGRGGPETGVLAVPTAPVVPPPQQSDASPVKVTGKRLQLAVILTPPLRRVVEESFPGYALPRVDWFESGLVLDLPSETGINPSVPFASVGDFDGNKLLDAVLLLQQQRKQWLLVAFHQVSPGSFAPHRIGWWKEQDWDRMGAISSRAGRKIEFYVEQLPGSLVKSLTGVELPYDGIYATASGSLAETFFYTDGKYRYVDSFTQGNPQTGPTPREPSQGGPLQRGAVLVR